MCNKIGRKKVFAGVCLWGVLLLVACGKKEVTMIGVAESSAIEKDAQSTLEGKPLDEIDQSASLTYIQVYVCGAVARPGVYTLQEGSRVETALVAAGGFSEEASRVSVNLAGWLQDGQMIYFPTTEEIKAQEAKALAEEMGIVNINTADVKSLCTLPGIGESKAADIISFREKNGPYKKPEDIMKVPGIKENLYQKIQERIAVE